MRRAGIAAAVLALAVLSLWPALDLAVSALFYDPAAKVFPIDGQPVMEALRRAVWGGSILMVLAALAGLVLALVRRGPVAGLPGRAWGFILALYALGPGLVVETLLKGQWGRARPAAVSEFGGTASFTPAWLPADQCARNCSFVGGEPAGAMVLALSLALILAWTGPRLSVPARRAVAALAIAAPVIASVQRLMAGRHFLSDILAAILVILLVAWCLARVLRPLPGAVDKAPDSP